MLQQRGKKVSNCVVLLLFLSSAVRPRESGEWCYEATNGNGNGIAQPEVEVPTKLLVNYSSLPARDGSGGVEGRR